jgi:hypothetical protein
VRRVLAALVLACVLAGCASTPGTTAPELSARARTQLQADVLAVARAAVRPDLTAARAALADLSTDLNALQATGAISPARAAQVGALVTKVRAQLTAATATRASSAPVSVAPVDRQSAVIHQPVTPTSAKPKPSPKPKPGGHGHGHGHGPGHDG